MAINRLTIGRNCVITRTIQTRIAMSDLTNKVLGLDYLRRCSSVPNYSEVLPRDVDLSSKVTRNID